MKPPLREKAQELQKDPALLPPAFVALAASAAFLPALKNGFVDWDDVSHIVKNAGYRGFDLVHLRWMFTSFSGGHYHPLTWLSFALDHRIWGLDPFGYHLTSLILHGLNAAVFYLLSLRLIGLAAGSPAQDTRALPWGACFTALLFAVHPLRVESVAWAIERRDVLSAFFYLLTMLFYLKACALPGGPAPGKNRRLAFALGAYALSLLSKGMGVTLPLALLLLDLYPLRRLKADPREWLSPEARPVLFEKAPFFALALAAGLVGFAAEIPNGIAAPMAQYGAAARAAEAMFGLAYYLRKTLAPFQLLPFHEAPLHPDPLAWPFLLSAFFVLALTLAFTLLRRRWPAGLAAWTFYGLTLAPVLNIVKFGPQLVAGRYSYLSCLGWALLAGGGLVWCLRSEDLKLRKTVLSGAAVLIAALGWLTWRQTQVWHDTQSLWSYVLSVDPRTSIGHHYIGNALFRQRRLDEAIAHFREAVRINPEYGIAYNSLGNALAAQGLLGEAAANYLKAIEKRPDYWEARNNLGLALARQGRLEEAIGHFREALRISPRRAGIHNNLGLAFMTQGKKAEAVEQFNLALTIDPHLAQSRHFLNQLAGSGPRVRPP